MNNYEIVISPENSKNGWHASVFKFIEHADDMMILINSKSCDSYVDACQTAWNIMQNDRGLRNSLQDKNNDN